MNRERIHELRELAVHQGLFVEGVCDEGVRVSFFEPIYVNETFLITEDCPTCPECGALLLEIEEPFKHQYDYSHICANTNCAFHDTDYVVHSYELCDECCSYDSCLTKEESTLGLELNFCQKCKQKYEEIKNSFKKGTAK